MFEQCHIRLPEAKFTQNAGTSLISTLYDSPVDIYLSGEVGTGKTTFVRAFAQALGISAPVTSPTFALEQRYVTASGTPLLHCDCYRLSHSQAAELLRTSDMHDGIRCIEWPENAGISEEPGIHIHLAEDANGRIMTVDFRDAPVPDDAQIDAWRTECGLPEHVAAHCDAVAGLATTLAQALMKNGSIIRQATLRACGRLHDLLRYLDFRSDPDDISPAMRKTWEHWRTRFAGKRHEEACAIFLRERGYTAVLPDIIAVHGLHLPSPPRRTIEQQLLYYADKRVAFDRIVSLEERFADFRKRYADSATSAEGDIWFAEAKTVERDLFPDGPPA